MILLINTLLQKYKKKLLLPATGIAIILFFVIRVQLESAPPSADLIQPIPFKETELEQENTTENLVESTTIYVEVKGAVLKPGVYELMEGDRVLVAIDLAGGYLPSSNSEHINHAQKVEDEMVIYVPVEGEEVDVLATSQGENSDFVNINKADQSILTTLPGVGPAKADAIIAYREEQGGFKEKQDLMKVTGIGQKTYEKLESLITVK